LTDKNVSFIDTWSSLPLQGDGVCGFTRRVATGCYALSFQDEIFFKVF
jgi:hypothetical protein